MQAIPLPSQKYLREIFSYDPANKAKPFIYKIRTSIRVVVGQRAGSPHIYDGSFQTTINYQICKIHRLVFMYHHGYCPDILDHIDGDRGNNSIENLRPANGSQNACNATISKNNTSGYKGVYYHKRKKKYHARIGVNLKTISLGYHKTAHEAHAAYCKAAKELHGEFYNPG